MGEMVKWCMEKRLRWKHSRSHLHKRRHSNNSCSCTEPQEGEDEDKENIPENNVERPRRVRKRKIEQQELRRSARIRTIMNFLSTKNVEEEIQLEEGDRIEVELEGETTPTIISSVGQPRTLRCRN